MNEMKNENKIKMAAKATAATPQRTSNDVLALNNMPRKEQEAYRNVLRGSLKHCIISQHDRAIDERHLTILDALLG